MLKVAGVGSYPVAKSVPPPAKAMVLDSTWPLVRPERLKLYVLPATVNVQKLVTGAESTTLLPSPVKLNEGVKVAEVCGRPAYVPVPLLRKTQPGLKNMVVDPPPLGPEADVVPKNDAEPVIIVFGTAPS